MPPLRLAELLASISLATDLGTGQPLGHGMRTCLLSVQAARELGCDDAAVRAVHHVSLLRFLGCTADAAETARLAGGDERAFNRTMAPVVSGGRGETFRALVGAIGPGEPPGRKARLLGTALADPGAGARSLATHCEVAAMLAHRLDLTAGVTTALQHAYERWDGRGFPAGLRGEDIPLEIRITSAAKDVDLAVSAGLDPLDWLRERSGKAHDPRVVAAFMRLPHHSVDADLSAVIAAEPTPRTSLVDVESALSVLADFVDLKSPWTRGHSRRVADLASEAGRHAGLPPAATQEIRLAGLVHDIGRVGVENGVWDKEGALSTDQWEKVRLHPYLTERILARCPRLAPLAAVAAGHHERLDRTGYPKQLAGEECSLPAQLLAAADVMAALTAPRPHRPALDREAATAVLAAEVKAGRLAARAVSCVVTAAGGNRAGLSAVNPGGLSDREVQVLGMIATGLTNRRVAAELHISPKTVGRHIENVYAKIGVSTRAAAAVYAMEHRLI